MGLGWLGGWGGGGCKMKASLAVEQFLRGRSFPSRAFRARVETWGRGRRVEGLRGQPGVQGSGPVGISDPARNAERFAPSRVPLARACTSEGKEASCDLSVWASGLQLQGFIRRVEVGFRPDTWRRGLPLMSTKHIQYGLSSQALASFQCLRVRFYMCFEHALVCLPGS